MDLAAAPRAIILDDDPQVLAVLSEALTMAGYAVSAVNSAEAAFAAMQVFPAPAILTTDIDLGNGPSGIAVAAHARKRWPNMPIFVISGNQDSDITVEAQLNLRFLAKPLRVTALLSALAGTLTSSTASANRPR